MVKPIALAICMAAVMSHTNAQGGEVQIFGGFFAYHDSRPDFHLDYSGYSPNGYFGIRYMHHIDDWVSVSAGWKHESSIAYKEYAGGFNGVFMEASITVWQ